MLLCLLAALLCPSRTAAQQAAISDCWMDGSGRLCLTAEVPAGAQYAALEAGAGWRTKLSAALDGRRARVTFRLPRDSSAPRELARVRTGPGPVPAPDIADSAGLISLFYEPQEIAEQARLDLLNAAGSKMRQWRDLPPAQYTANLTAWLKTSPLVAKAVVSEISSTAVLVQFMDGEWSTLYLRRRVEESIAPAAPPLPLAPVRAARSTSTEVVTGLPGSRHSICAYSLEAQIFPNSAPTIAGWLSRSGYQVQTLSSTTIEEIAAWSSAQPLGVLFWQAHGVPYFIDGIEGGRQGICLVTRQAATAGGRLSKYSAGIRRGELGLAKDDSETQPTYTITSNFVRSYLRFAPHSLVMLDACFGAHTELTNAFIEQGAGAVGSWDIAGGKDSGTPILKVFDRLLGTNEEPPISFPKERPFALPVIQMWQLLRGYDVDPSPKYPGQTDFNARLIWNMNPSRPAHILRPSIMRVLYEGAAAGEEYSKLLIEGDFGSDPGTARRRLYWGGQPVNILRWAPDGITIRPPEGMPAGSFQAVIDQVHTSNERPFTEWTVPFSYTHNGRGSLNYTVQMNVRMRADIAGTRGMPEMPVQYLPVNFWHLNDSTGSLSAGGSYSPDPHNTITWSGASQLRSWDPEVSGSELRLNAIQNSGTMDVVTGAISDFQVQGTGQFTETITRQAPQEVSGTTPILLYPPLTPSLNPGSYAFTGGSRSFTAPDGSGSAQASWPAVIPRAAPQAETVR